MSGPAASSTRRSNIGVDTGTDLITLMLHSTLLVDLNDRQIYIEMRIDQTILFIVLVFLEQSQFFHCHEHAVLRSLKTIHLKIFHQSNHQKTHSKRQYKIKFTSGPFITISG